MEKTYKQEYFSSFAKQLISSCLCIEAKESPSFKSIVLMMESNRYKLILLKESETKELEIMIVEHQSKIQSYKKLMNF